LDPNAESDSEVGSNKGLFTKQRSTARVSGNRESETPRILRAAAGRQTSDGRAGRQAGRQGSVTRANRCIDPEAEESQVSAR